MRRSLVLLASVVLASCGGSEGGADALAPAVNVDLAQVLASWEIDAAGVGGDAAGDGGAAGAAGDGSPLKRARVVLVDSQGKTVSGTTDDKGHYLLRFKTAEFKPPFVVKVLDADSNVLASTTGESVTTGKVTRVNINPLTDKVTFDALKSVTGTDREFSGAQIDASRLTKAKADVTTSVKAALGVAGLAQTDKFDPVQSVYKYNGTGVDAVIESISHVRNPQTGATELRAKLAPLVTNADGTVSPTLITAASPLATTQVAVAANPALTFTKITAWIDRINRCLALPTGSETAECNDAAFTKVVSPQYKHSSKDFDEDFRTLCSESDNACISGSELRNPNILFLSRSAGSDVDDTAVVEITIRQPRTGPLAGNLSTPIEYTKVLVFRRDDTTPGLVAGNWILNGNQRAHDWSVEPQYYTFQAANPKFDGSISLSSIRFTISTRKYDAATRTFVDADLYAARVKGPGLPAGGVVYAPTTSDPTSTSMTILNKSGVIPTPGTKSNRAQSDFRISGVSFPSGAALSGNAWSGSPTGSNAQHYSDSPLGEFSALQAYSVYTIELYRNGQTEPVVETSRILAAVASPTVNLSRALHDLSPNLALISPPQPAITSATVSWVRNPLGVRIDNAFFLFNGTGSTNRSVPDANALAPTSTSITMNISQGTAPANDGTVAGQGREIGINGRAARARYGQSLNWYN